LLCCFVVDGMRIVTFLLTFILFIFVGGSVCATHYSSSRIKHYATNTPRAVENNLSSLTRHLIRPLDDDYDKAKMIAFWIASHINYDEYLYNDGATTKLIKTHKTQSSDELLESRVGICGEFATLFNDMCRIAGIRSGIITGYAYPSRLRLRNKERKNAAHAWNYFLYKGKRIYVDTTFMARGKTSPRRRATEVAHKRALRKVQHDNEDKSQINDFNDFYFDFSYKDEMKKSHYIHEEQ